MEPDQDGLTPIQYAEMMLRNTEGAELFSEGRSSELSDEFTRLEGQIAAILFAFVGFATKFIDSGFAGLPDYGVLLIKIMFSLVVFGLVASLAFGLIQLKRKEQFWNTLMRQRCARIDMWRKVLRGDASVKEARAFADGSRLGDGELVTGTPSWPWILQTACLAGSVVLILLLFTVYLVK